MQRSSSSSSTLCDAVPARPWSARAMVMQLGGHTSTQSPHRMHRSGSSITLSKQRRQRRDSSQASCGVVADLDLGEADPPVGRRRRDRPAGDGVVAGRQPAEAGAGGSARPGPRRIGAVPARAAWMDAAARWPSAMASMRLRGPWATSPPAQIRGCEVRSVAASTWTTPRLRLEVDAGEHVEVGGLADGEDHRVGRQHRLGAGDERRVEPALVVEHRLHVDRLEPGDPAAVADEAVRARCGRGW